MADLRDVADEVLGEMKRLRDDDDGTLHPSKRATALQETPDPDNAKILTRTNEP